MGGNHVVFLFFSFSYLVTDEREGGKAQCAYPCPPPLINVYMHCVVTIIMLCVDVIHYYIISTTTHVMMCVASIHYYVIVTTTHIAVYLCVWCGGRQAVYHWVVWAGGHGAAYPTHLMPPVPCVWCVGADSGSKGQQHSAMYLVMHAPCCGGGTGRDARLGPLLVATCQPSRASRG
jgi:hypothetical protein